MKKILSLAAVIMAVSNAPAALYTFNSGFANSGVIPDANPSGWSDTRTLSGITGTSITDLNVVLTLSGGYNGDLYGYLLYQATPGASVGTMAVLLNRVGAGSGSEPQFTYGFSTAGFANVTLDDQGVSGNIHSVANPTSGLGVSYTPDGGSLASFNGLNPNGTWTLLFADLSAGDQSTVTSWSLDITAVPEPTSVALVIFGGLALGMGRVRWWQGRRRAAV
jgi:hypothetical protein